MNIELIIFDSDGVLVDSEPIAQRLFYEMIKECGLDIETVDGSGANGHARRYTGMSLPRCVELIQKEFQITLPQDFISRYEQRLYPVLKERIEPIAGVRQILPLLPYKMCVASSGPMSKLEVTLGASGLLPFFEGRVFSGDHVSHGKPHPDIFLFSAREMRVDPSACIVVEDSVNGIQAGLAAGMRVCAYDSENTLGAQPNGVVLFRDMRDLPEVLRQLATGA